MCLIAVGPFQTPISRWWTAPLAWSSATSNAPAPHAALMQNFVDAILDGAPLIAPGEDGIHSVELANVMLYSSLIDKTVELPMNSAAFEKKLKQLIAGSTTKKKVVEISTEDFTKSFSR